MKRSPRAAASATPTPKKMPPPDPELSPTAAGWSLVAGPLLIAMAGGIALRRGPRGVTLPAWGLVGAGAIAIASFLSAASNRTGTSVPPNGYAVALAEATFVAAIAVAHVLATARRQFLAGALLGIGLLNLAFAIQGLATWGPSPAFSVGPATYARLVGGLLLLAASAVRRETVRPAAS